MIVLEKIVDLEDRDKLLPIVDAINHNVSFKPRHPIARYRRCAMMMVSEYGENPNDGQISSKAFLNLKGTSEFLYIQYGSKYKTKNTNPMNTSFYVSFGKYRIGVNDSQRDISSFLSNYDVISFYSKENEPIKGDVIYYNGGADLHIAIDKIDGLQTSLKENSLIFRFKDTNEILKIEDLIEEDLHKIIKKVYKIK